MQSVQGGGSNIQISKLGQPSRSGRGSGLEETHNKLATDAIWSEQTDKLLASGKKGEISHNRRGGLLLMMRWASLEQVEQ